MPATLERISGWARQIFASKSIKTILLSSDRISKGELNMFSLVFDFVFIRSSVVGSLENLLAGNNQSNVRHVVETNNERLGKIRQSEIARWFIIGEKSGLELIKVFDTSGLCSRTILIGNRPFDSDLIDRVPVGNLFETEHLTSREGKTIECLFDANLSGFEGVEFVLIEDSERLRADLAASARLRINENFKGLTMGLS